MSNPFPNMIIEFETKAFNIEITDTNTQNIKSYNQQKNVTNYEYEVKKNEDKRQILILKKEYLGSFVSDIKNIMKYDKSSQYLNSTTKKV